MTRTVLNPADQSRVGERLIAREREIEAVLAAATAAQAGWSALDAKTRAGYLHRIADRIESADPEAVAACRFPSRRNNESDADDRSEP